MNFNESFNELFGFDTVEEEAILTPMEELAMEATIEQNLEDGGLTTPNFVIESQMEIKRAQMDLVAEEYFITKYDEYATEAFGYAQSREMKEVITEGFKDSMRSAATSVGSFYEKLKAKIHALILKIKAFLKKTFFKIQRWVVTRKSNIEKAENNMFMMKDYKVTVKGGNKITDDLPSYLARIENIFKDYDSAKLAKDFKNQEDLNGAEKGTGKVKAFAASVKTNYVKTYEEKQLSEEVSIPIKDFGKLQSIIDTIKNGDKEINKSLDNIMDDINKVATDAKELTEGSRITFINAVTSIVTYKANLLQKATMVWLSARFKALKKVIGGKHEDDKIKEESYNPYDAFGSFFD